MVLYTVLYGHSGILLTDGKFPATMILPPSAALVTELSMTVATTPDMTEMLLLL
ncbi:MAG: hypothetical protein R1F54_10150 [Candidatus Zeuxoniibacter abyssi]|nr:MAG: hypothetical protein R1F54_10150 [Candidatus Persebacteraceae bacterium AB1(2)]